MAYKVIGQQLKDMNELLKPDGERVRGSWRDAIAAIRLVLSGSTTMAGVRDAR